MEHLTTVAYAVIAATSAWAAIRPDENTKLAGSVILMVISFTAFAQCCWTFRFPQRVPQSESILVIAIAVWAIRTYFVKDRISRKNCCPLSDMDKILSTKD